MPGTKEEGVNPSRFAYLYDYGDRRTLIMLASSGYNPENLNRIMKHKRNKRAPIHNTGAQTDF